jgi:metal-sulfur cluster biosynthetic enzyme
MATSEDVYTELRQVFDPEIPVNIVDLGLIYEVGVEEGIAQITMTLTSQSCPSAQEIPEMMRKRVDKLEGVTETKIDVVYQPQWTVQMISEEGRKLLGMEDPE